MPRPRRLARRARAARLLLQLAARGVPALHRARRAARDRPRPARPGHVALDRGGRARPVDDRQPELLRLGHRGDRRALRDPARRALARAHDGAAGQVPARHRRRAHLRHVPQPDGAQAPVHDGLRGAPRQPPAQVPRDRLLARARPDRGVHELPALPGVQRRAAEARGARGDDRRPLDPRLHADVGRAGAPLRRRARAHEDGGAHRPAHPEGGARAADLPRERRRRLPAARPRGEDALGRRGAAAPARDADRIAARRRPLHPRRAVDRAPPARQRQAHPHARAAPRRRQHRARRRARRADDARGGLGRRPRAGRRRARGRGGRGGDCGRHRDDAGLGHRPVPERRAADPRAAEARRRRARLVLGPRRVDAQPEGHRRRLPRRPLHRGDRACPARASRPSSTRSSTRRSRTGSTGCG